ncbi:MAG TPA: prolipoprotein diacylglyceryl transferase [Gemmatimonadaceae bacterium]|nr:prolipoprotein diacylglyceryl transferase [Gemmatimonadaceae bacterium]
MPITHHPFEINLGPIPLTGFGLAVLAAFVIAQIISQRELLQRGHKTEAEAIPDLILASVIGTLIGGRLYYVLVVTGDWSDLLGRAGFVFWGGFIGAVILNWIVIRRKKLSFTRISDVGGIAIAAGYSVGRTGCWAVGDDYGRPWDGALAVRFPQGAPPSTAGVMNDAFGTPIPPGASADTVLAVHPTQLYETALGLVMFLILWRFRRHPHAAGWLFGLYGVLAGAERFVIEFFRAKDDRFVGPFTLAQMIAVAIAAAGAAWMLNRRRPARGSLAPAT